MPSRPRPTILTSRSIPGTVSPTTHRNLLWSDDGQCLIIHRKGVTLATPYLASTLPPPLSYLDVSKDFDSTTQPPFEPSKKSKGKSKAVEDDDSDGDSELGDRNGNVDGIDRFDTNGTGSSTLGRRLRKPKAGEVKWWFTGLEVEKGAGREEQYGWAEFGDEYSVMFIEKERYIRTAVWSPSGLNDLGGCLLAVLTSHHQVSVYAPRSDPFTKQFVEIEDLTLRVKDLLDKREANNRGRDVSAMFELRTTCIQWSKSLPLPTALGIDGSLLGLGSRGGKLGLWTYGTRRRFERVGHMRVSEGWVVDMAWSDWVLSDEQACDGKLAMAMSDGSVSLLPVSRQSVIGKDGQLTWNLRLGKVEVIDKGDKRSIAGIKWLQLGILVWTKPGSVHFWSLGSENVRWSGQRNVRLEKVGDWAGANPLSPCVGMYQPTASSLVLTSSSLSHHIINGLLTEPRIAEHIENVALTLSARDVFLNYVHEDYMIRNRFRKGTAEDRAFSAFTTGWSGIGDNWGSAAVWIGEPMTFHNLDSGTEGSRAISFLLADLGRAIPSQEFSLIDHLQSLAETPPNLLTVAPFKLLIPSCLHILASADPDVWAQPLLDLLRRDIAVSRPTPQARIEASDLFRALWDDKWLNGMRIKLVLAGWCSRIFPTFSDDFYIVVKCITQLMEHAIYVVLLRWIASTVEQPGSAPLKGKDLRFLQSLQSQEGQLDGLDDSVRSPLQAIINGAKTFNSAAQEICPACGGDMGNTSNGAICVKGHEWARCSITRLLITDPNYKVCTSCSAVALLHEEIVIPPKAVDASGKGHDHERFEARRGKLEEGPLVQKALKAGVGCLICGGRWVRAV